MKIIIIVVILSIGAIASGKIFNVETKSHGTLTNTGSPKLFDIPAAPKCQPIVWEAIPQLSIARMQQFLNTFTAFNNRYYESESGVEASNWLMARVQNIISTSGYNGNASVEQYVHPWAQRSVIARIQGSNPSGTGIVILGAHLDSSSGSPTHRAPGADDNATGCATLLETFQTLLEIGFIPKAGIEFHFYAAEEMGLIGSKAIAEKYARDGTDVIGMINFDMTGYVGSDTRIAIVMDYTDQDLNQFLRVIVEEYSILAWVNSNSCPGCSDHATWHNEGYRSAFPYEMHENPHTHSELDDITKLSFGRMLELTKVSVGFAIELAETDNLPGYH